MKLVGTALSPFASRVILAARLKSIDLEIVEPEGGLRSAAHLALSPIGKVPVLVDGDIVLPESGVILEYLDDRFPEPPLFPGDARARANVRLLARINDTYSLPSFGPFLSRDPAAIAAALERIDTSLGYLDHFRIDGEFASGDTFSAADCTLMPFFHLYEVLQDGFGAFDLVRRRPRLEAWWARSRESRLGTFIRGAIDEALAKFSV